MKKQIYLLLLAVSVMLISCNSDDITVGIEQAQKRVFTAEAELPGDITRTTLNPDNYVIWTDSDNIAIFDKSTLSDKYKLIAGVGSNKGSFAFVDTQGKGDFEAGTEINNVIAIYPYSPDYEVENTGSGGYIIRNITIPAEQTYREKFVLNDLMPMVAVSTTNDLKFKNVGSLIKLKVKAPAGKEVKLNKIIVSSRDLDPFVGTSEITIGADGKDPKDQFLLDSASPQVTLNCNNVKLSDTTATTFYIAVNPHFVLGLMVKLFDDASNSMMVTSTRNIQFKRNQILVMPEITFEPESESQPIVPELPAHVKWIDLGLPSGTKWANCNLGADSPEEPGDNYAWGEITTKEYYSETTYKYCANDTTLNKVVFEDLGDISGNPEYDAATAHWGEPACMPTLADFEELLNTNNCTMSKTTQNGADGYLFTSKKNGNSIFLPVAYYRYNNVFDPFYSCYWTTTLDKEYLSSAAVFQFIFIDDFYRIIEMWSRCDGCIIRPVSK